MSHIDQYVGEQKDHENQESLSQHGKDECTLSQIPQQSIYIILKTYLNVDTKRVITEKYLINDRGDYLLLTYLMHLHMKEKVKKN